MEQEKILELRLEVQRFIRLFGVMEQSVTPCGFPLSISQVMALQELEKNVLTVNELAKHLLLERSTVSRLVDSLVKGDFVKRETNDNNRREVNLSLTPKGLNAVQRVREQSVQFFQTLLKNIPDLKQQQILESFQYLTNSLADVRGKQNGDK